MKEKTLLILNKTFQYGFGVTPFIILRNPKIPFRLKPLYELLLSYAWYDAECFPGQEKLSSNLGLSITSIGLQLNELKELKLIDWKRRGLNKTNIYYILDIPEELMPDESEAESNPDWVQEPNVALTPTIEIDEEEINTNTKSAIQEETGNTNKVEERLAELKRKRLGKQNSFGSSYKPQRIENKFPEKKKVKYVKVDL